MNVIRKQILINSLKISNKFKKNVDGVLEKFVKDTNKINSIKSILHGTDVTEVFKELINNDLFYDSDLEYVIIEEWEKLSQEQHKEILLILFNDENIGKTVSSLENVNSHLRQLFNVQLGDLLYDISFLNKLPKKTSSPWKLELIRDIQSFDFSKIISDDILFDYYINNTSVFKSLSTCFKFSPTSEEANKLIERGILWPIKFSDLKNDVNFVENIIVNHPKEVDRKFISCLSEEIRKNQRIQYAILLSGAKNFDLLVDRQNIIDNLYMLKYTSKDRKLINDNYDLDKKEYALVTINDYIINGIVIGNYGPNIKCHEKIWNQLSDEEKKYVQLVDEMDNGLQEFIIYNDSNSLGNRLNFSKLLMYDNKILNLGVSDEKINSVLKNNPNIINLLVEKKQLNRVAAINLYYAIYNDVVDIFLDFCNLGVVNKVNMSIVTKELIGKIGYDIIRNVSLYPESMYYLLQLEKKGKLDSYRKLLTIINNLPLDIVRTSNILVYTYISFEKFIDQMVANNELNEENVLKLVNMTQHFSLVDVSKCVSIKDYHEKTNEFCDNNIMSSVNPLISRELLCQRFFGSSYDQMMNFYDSFSCSIDKIKDINIQNMFKMLQFIKDNNNLDEIKRVYVEFQQANFKVDSVNLFLLTEQLKKEIIGNLVNHTIDKQNVDNIVDFTGKDFSCLIHVMGGYSAIVSADSLYESWNSNTRIENTGICTSLINGNYFGHAETKKDSVIFGFDNISSSEIQLMGPYDLYSSAYGLETTTRRSVKYYNAEELVNNTRAHHNEVLINRNLNGGNKRQPSYILCFDNINNESKKASKQFGVPIVFVNVKKHLEVKRQEIEKLKDDFINNQSVDIMKKIINMQETLRCGLLANNAELAELYFNKENVTNNILFLINNCNSNEILEQLEKIVFDESNRATDTNDHRNVTFNGDLGLIMSELKMRKDSLAQSNLLSNFNFARYNQRIIDQKEREERLNENILYENMSGGRSYR